MTCDDTCDIINRKVADVKGNKQLHDGNGGLNMGMKKIGVLTSGGDAPGMNAAVWATAKSAFAGGMEVYAIMGGYQGLFDRDIRRLKGEDVESIMHLGGTVIGTARCKGMMTDEGRDQAVSMIREFGLDGIVVIGGDGSFRGARELSVRGVSVVCMPGTIDNDLSYTDYTIGYDTACNTALEAIAKIHDTMVSHNRVAVVEVMGRDCGDIALTVGMATGADYVLVPEVQYDVPFDLDNLSARMLKLKAQGKKNGLVIISEGVQKQFRHPADELRDRLATATGLDVRASVLGHIQRGGMPTVRDRRVAVEMGVHAVDLLEKGYSNRVIGVKHGAIMDMDIMEALQIPRTFDKAAYDAVMKLGLER